MDESDRYRMLVQAGALVRVINSTQNENSFICMAVYITRSIVAERFLVYQPDRNASRVNGQLFNSVSLQLISSFSQVEYVRDIFRLTVPYEAFQFFFELHNLPSTFPPDAQARNASSHSLTLNIQVQDENLGSYTSMKKLKPDGPKPKGKEPNAAPPGSNPRRQFVGSL